MKRIVGALCLSVLLGFGCLAGAAEDKPKILITTGGIGGVYYYYGTAVAEILTKYAGVEANYVAFGRFFASSTKPLAAPAQVETLTKAKKMMTIPVVAIGGILPENGRDLIHAGADILAVIGGLMTKEPELSARNYDDLFALK